MVRKLAAAAELAVNSLSPALSGRPTGQLVGEPIVVHETSVQAGSFIISLIYLVTSCRMTEHK